MVSFSLVIALVLINIYLFIYSNFISYYFNLTDNPFNWFELYFLNYWIKWSCSNILCSADSSSYSMYFFAFPNWLCLLFISDCNSFTFNLLSDSSIFKACYLVSNSCLLFNMSNRILSFNSLMTFKWSPMLSLKLMFSLFKLDILSSTTFKLFYFDNNSSCKYDL